jgi:hypothetical protein
VQGGGNCELHVFYLSENISRWANACTRRRSQKRVAGYMIGVERGLTSDKFHSSPSLSSYFLFRPGLSHAVLGYTVGSDCLPSTSVLSL